MNSIAKQILASLLITVALVFGGGGYVELQQAWRADRDQLLQQQSNSLTRLAFSLSYPLWNLSRAEVEVMLRNEARDAAVRAIVVQDDDRTPYAGVVRQGDTDEVLFYTPDGRWPIEPQSANNLAASRDVVKDGKVIGQVTLYLNAQHFNGAARQEAMALLYRVLAYSLALFLVQALVLRVVVVRPLQRLTDWAQSWSSEHALQALPAMRSREMDALMRSFSALTKRLALSVSDALRQREEAKQSEQRIRALYSYSRALNEMSEAVLDATDSVRLLHQVARILGATLGADTAAVYDLVDRPFAIDAVANWWHDPALAPTDRVWSDPVSMDRCRDLLAEIRRSGQWQVSHGSEVHPLLSDSGASDWLHESRKDNSYLFYPLEHSGDTLRVVVLGYLSSHKEWSDEEIHFIEDVGKQVRIALAKIRLMQERERNEARIQHLATRDALTSLPNRVLLGERVAVALSLAKRNDTSLALLFIDLDHFKDINDALGHSVGDALLVALAQRLQSRLREQDILARQGGDEFIAILSGVDADGAAKVASDLLEAMTLPCRIEQHDLGVTCSIGIAMYPADGEDFQTLYRNADAAMYRVKDAGRNGHCFFTPEMQITSARHLSLVSALRQAIERDQLSVHYQPQLSLKDGRIIGAEALLRWQHPEFGAVSPAEFIPIAENSGLIGALGTWVLRTAVRQARAWQERGFAPLIMAVNLSAVQFRQADLPEQISQILKDEGLAPQWLELELTEGVMTHNPQAAIDVMDDLDRRGVRMAIDDFGTGYSSISYLKKFKAYKLKIDQSFVRDISTDADDRAIVTAIIDMAKRLNLLTIAEGVETEAQRAFLGQNGCDEAQGYLYSRPLLPEAFEAFMRSREVGVHTTVSI